MNLREWALPVYTTMMQLAAGALFLLWVIRSFAVQKYGRDHIDRVMDNPILIIFLTVLVAMFGSHFHLSKPYQAFLAVLNFRNSWLSREVVFTLIVFTLLVWLLYLQLTTLGKWRLTTAIGWLAILFFAANTYAMSQIYLLPTQAAWDTPMTVVSFFGTALLLGGSALVSILIMDLKYSELRALYKVEVQTHIIQNALPGLGLLSLGTAIVVVGENLYQLQTLANDSMQTAQVSVYLLLQLYPALFGMRITAMLLGVFVLIGAILWLNRTHKTVSELFAAAYCSCLLVMVGEFLGRFLFYATHIRLGL